MTKFIRTIGILGYFVFSMPVLASITVGGTRLIYNATENEASLP